MVDPSQIREHLELVGPDGQHAGPADQVIGDRIERAGLDLAGWFRRHIIRGLRLTANSRSPR